MKLDDIKIGDIVQLNSGGAKMTVLDVTRSGSVICAWQTPTESHVETFPAEALKPEK